MYFKVFILFVLSLFCVSSKSIIAQGKSTVDSLSKALLTSSTSKVRITTLLNLSKEVEGLHPQQSIDYASQALKLAEEANYTELSVSALIQLSSGYHKLGNFEDSYEYAQIAKQLGAKHKMRAEVTRANRVLSTIYHDLGDFDKSAKIDFENLKYYEEIGDREQIGLVLGNIGIAFISQKNFERGLEYLRRSFDIAHEMNDLHGMAYQYNNIAGVYFEFFNDYQTALQHYKEALSINKKLDDRRQEAIYEMNIASCFSRLNLNDSAMVYFLKSKNAIKSLGDLALFSNILVYFGEFHFSIGNIDESIQSGSKAFEISVENDYKEWLMAASSLLYKSYLVKGDTLQAYKYLKVHYETKDVLTKQQNEYELFKLEFQYSFEKIERERQIAAQRRDNLMFFIIFCLLTGLVIIVLLYSRHRQKSKIIALEKESMGKELEFKNKELTINLMALMKKNEMLSEISDKLNEVEKGAKRPETKDAIRRISKEIRQGADDKMLKEFSQRFQEVHVGFYNALLGKFPDLTQNELKLCAFLRINMSSKDISELTGQRIETIEQARYRLRRKLNISNSDINLVTFLAQI